MLENRDLPTQWKSEVDILGLRGQILQKDQELINKEQSIVDLKSIILQTESSSLVAIQEKLFSDILNDLDIKGSIKGINNGSISIEIE